MYKKRFFIRPESISRYLEVLGIIAHFGSQVGQEDQGILMLFGGRGRLI